MTAPPARRRPVLVVVAPIGICVGIAAALVPGVHLRGAILIGWCAGIGMHSALLVKHLVAAAREVPPGATPLVMANRSWAIGGSLAAAFAALAAVSWEFGSGSPPTAFSVPLGVATIVLSWLFLHVLFACHYAQAYWRTRKGFDFPGEGEPEATDFLYLAITVGITGSVSDVTLTSAEARRLVLTHGAAAFAFNAAIVGAAVNLLA